MAAPEMDIECEICGTMLHSADIYYEHNVHHHSLMELSREILRLKKLQLSLRENLLEDKKGKNAKSTCTSGKNIPDVPIKVELVDEEVIELGPTENADDLHIQSRLVKNSNEMPEHPSQVIEVKENNRPACYINPSGEDLSPDAIVVKFDKDLVMALDDTRSNLTSEDPGKSKRRNRELRAIVKTSIEIPDPNMYFMDYQCDADKKSQKYVMRSVSLSSPSFQKRKRGRPKKLPENQKQNNVKKEKKIDDDSEEETDWELLAAAPPLFSDDDEAATATVPDVKKTRSGRTIKMKKEDETFKYYDVLSKDSQDAEDVGNHKEDWVKETNLNPTVTKGKRGRKRKRLHSTQEKAAQNTEMEVLTQDTEGNVTEDAGKRVTQESNISQETVSTVNTFNVSQILHDSDASEPDLKEEHRKNLEVGEPSIQSPNHIAQNTVEVDDDVSDLNSGVYECFLCFKSFAEKEDCEKHTQEHLSNVAKIEEASESTTQGMEKDDDDDDGDENVISHADITSPIEDDMETAEGDSGDSDDFSNSKEKTSHFCSVCKEYFVSANELKGHTHDPSYAGICCGKQYQSKMSLQMHMKRYHEDTDWMKFKCSICGKNFGFLTALERHMREHNPNQKFCCDQCGKVFKSLVNLKNHIPLHTRDEIFECPYCPKKYYLKPSYERHVKSHISAPKFHCEVCDRNFSERKHFELHLERHQFGGCLGRSKDFKCNHCGDIKSVEYLEILGKIDPGHHKTCSVCGKGLYKKYLIDNCEGGAFRSNDDRQREQCSLCGKWVLNMKRHIKHTHLQNISIPCDICGMVVSKASLPAHKNRRHGGSSVTCDHCGRIFKNIMCLREHMSKIKRKEDPVKNVCKVCKETVSLDDWKEHMMQHKTKCNDCGGTDFATRKEFLAHLDSCRQCSNCGMSTFASREEFLSHIEVCSSGIDIISGMDATGEQEVVTSIFTIVSCETCAEIFTDQESLAHHVAEAHPSELLSGQGLEEASEAILYACPQPLCGSIVTNRASLKNHLSVAHNIDVLDIDDIT